MDGQQPPREFVVLQESDQHGQLLRHVKADGTCMERTYFPAGGESGKCLPDPFGTFARFVKTLTKTGSEGAFQFRVDVAYAMVPVVDDDASYVVKVSMASRFDEVRVEQWRLACTYHQTDTDAHIYSRSETATVQLCGAAGSPQHASAYDYTRAGLVFTTTETVTNHDSLCYSRVSESYMAQQLVLRETDRNGNSHNHTYDAQRRLLRTTNNHNSPYEQTTRTAYLLGDNGTLVSIHEMSPGRREKQQYDGHENPVHRWIEGATDIWFDIHTASYDNFGRCESETWHDHACNDTETEVSQSYSRTTTFGYDDWDFAERTIDHYGVNLQEVIDPIALSMRTRTSTTVDLYDYDETDDRYDLLQVYDLFGDVVDAKSFDSAGRLYSQESWSYDGLSRPVSHMNTMGACTVVDGYDAFGRSTSATLPDQAHLAVTSAAHTTLNLLESVFLSNPNEADGVQAQVLNQLWDGLNRKRSQTALGPPICYTYNQQNKTPSTVAFVDSSIMAKSVETALAEALTAVTDLPSTGHSSNSTHIYYTVNDGNPGAIGLLKQANDEQETATVSYDALGQFTKVDTNRTGSIDSVEVTRRTLRGLPLEAVIASETLTWTYDSSGRTQSVVHGRWEHRLFYDRFNEVAKIESCYGDAGAGTFVETQHRASDGYGRIKDTKVTDSQGRTLQQSTLTYNTEDHAEK